MAVPRFLEFAENYPGALAGLSQGIGEGIQEGGQIADTFTKIRAQKAQKAADAAKASAGGSMIGPAAIEKSYNEYRKTLVDSGDTQAVKQLDKNYSTYWGVQRANQAYRATNLGYKNLTSEQKTQLQIQLQKQTGLSLSSTNKMLSQDGGVYSQSGLDKATNQHKYQQVLSRGYDQLAREGKQYGMSADQYVNYIKTHLGVQ